MSYRFEARAQITIRARHKAAGMVRLHKASWSDLPAIHHVVNARCL
jgi:hypothetical protein